MYKYFFFIFSIFFMTGCANQEPLKKVTSSGKPEGVYSNTTKSSVKDALSTYCNERGFIVLESTDSGVFCSKKTEGGTAVMSQLAIGNSYSTTPEVKLKFSISEVGEVIKVWADAWFETQMAMGQVNRMDIKNNSDLNQIQDRLDNLSPKKIQEKK